MKIQRWWARLSFFRKTFIVLVLLITTVVALVEGVLEPFAQAALLEASGGVQPWHEAIMWGVSIIFPSLICGFIFSRILSRRLDGLACAADRIARGDFSARINAGERADDPFGRLADSFNSMAASLEKLVENERRLLTDISHELRSPLARMGISLELLPMKEGAARGELIGRLEKEVAFMSRLVGLLLAQGRERLSHGQEMSFVALDSLLFEIADDIRFQGQVDGIDVVCEITGKQTVRGNAGQLRTMLMNVASNALFYTPPGEPVIMKLFRENDAIVISIRDFGPGVPEERLQDIFRAFYRVDDSRTRSSGGAGLGLALAKEAVESCGGSIRACNTEPGLEIRMTFPAATPG